MARRNSARRQRVPMVDADTLEDRTRPPPNTSRPLWLRLSYRSWAVAPTGLMAYGEKKRGGSPLAPGGSR